MNEEIPWGLFFNQGLHHVTSAIWTFQHYLVMRKLGLIIEHRLMLRIITTPFHNINYTILSLAIAPYLCYDPLMAINAPNFGTKYARMAPPRWLFTSTMARRNTMPNCTYVVNTIADVIRRRNKWRHWMCRREIHTDSMRIRLLSPCECWPVWLNAAFGTLVLH